MGKRCYKKLAITVITVSLLLGVTTAKDTSAENACDAGDANEQILNGYYNFIVSGATYSIEATDKGKAEKLFLCVPAEHNNIAVNEIAWKGLADTEAEEIYFVDSSAITKLYGHAFENAKAMNPIDLINITEVPIKAFNNTQFLQINLDGNKITSIGTASLSLTNARHPISLPLVTEIPLDAFSASQFTEIHLDKDKVTTLGVGAFSGSRATNKMELTNLVDIPSDAFSGSFFSEIHLDWEKIETLGFSAFDTASATNPVRFPNVTKIEHSTFLYSNFSKIELNPDKITEIGHASFEGTRATNSMHLPNIKDIPRNAFTWAEFSELTFDKDKVTSIGENSLMGANARNVIDLTNITVIPNNAFKYSAFSNILIDKNKITEIGSQSFTDSEASYSYLIEVNGNNLTSSTPSDYKSGVFNKTLFTKGDDILYIDRVGLFTSNRLILIPEGNLTADKVTNEMIDNGIDVSDKTELHAGVDHDFNRGYTLVSLPWHDEPYLIGSIYDLLSAKDIPVTPPPDLGQLELFLDGSRGISLSVELTGLLKEEVIDYANIIRVSDKRDIQESWSLSVKSTPLRNSEGHELESGILKFRGFKLTDLTTTDDISVIEEDASAEIVLDTEPTEVLHKEKGGIFQHEFDSLVMVVDPSKIKLSRSDTTYTSTITWTVTAGP